MVAYKRRYLKGQNRWVYQYVVDSAAQELIDRYGVDPEGVESAIDLAEDYERRMAFQADVQDYVDQSISSTINLPSWGSKLNNDDTVEKFASTLANTLQGCEASHVTLMGPEVDNPSPASLTARQ